MKIKLIAFAIAMSFASSAFAQSLPAWDQLTEAQRDTLAASVKERWNNNPEHRAKMLEHAQKWTSMTPDQRKAAMHGRKKFREMSPERREGMRSVYYKAQSYTDATQRKEFLDGIRKMTPEQRAAWVKANPAPADAKIDMPRGGKHHGRRGMKGEHHPMTPPPAK